MFRRVLVTNKDGTQSVKTIENELGLKAGDIDGTRARLAQQGVDAANISFFGGMDTRDKNARAQVYFCFRHCNPLLQCDHFRSPR
jgi:hypothetical protein